MDAGVRGFESRTKPSVLCLQRQRRRLFEFLKINFSFSRVFVIVFQVLKSLTVHFLGNRLEKKTFCELRGSSVGFLGSVRVLPNNFQFIIFRPYFISKRKIFKSNSFFYKICQEFIYIKAKGFHP